MANKDLTDLKDLLEYASKREYPDNKLENTDFEYKIKFTNKKSIVIGNPEGMDIKNIIKSADLQINKDEDNIVVLGNIVGSTFSKNPLLTKDFGEDDGEKLHTYYKRIIKNKSFNDANIKFCNHNNVTFIMGNRELDLIKIKDLVKLKMPEMYGKDTIDDYVKNRGTIEFEVESIDAFYPFWVKYYFKDNYIMPSTFKFIKRFKKLFKSIDAEMLLFTLFYELNKNDELLNQLTSLAISYFYKMTDAVNGVKEYTPLEISGDDEKEKFKNLPSILDKLDYLAFYVFKYFSTNENLENLLTKADFILQLKVSNSYYLLSHGGITENMFDTNSSIETPISIQKINDFIESYYEILCDSEKIKKLEHTNTKIIIDIHNKTKEKQAKYYNELIKSKDCKIDKVEEIEFKPFDDLTTNITDSYKYNLLLLNTLHRRIGKINEQLIQPQMGGFVGQKKSKLISFNNDVREFTEKSQKEITKYNVYLKNVVIKLLEDGGCVEDNKPSKNLLLILMLAHSFNSEIFKSILNITAGLENKFKSKNYSVFINTIFDHRAKHNTPFKNVHQIIANSNNTAQITEVIYDSIFFGTVIDCYETIVQGRHHEKNYIISIDNSAIIKHYSYFDSYTVLFIEPNLKDIFDKNQMSIKTKIQKENSDNIFIFNTLENIYKVINHKIKEQKITVGAKIKESKTTSTYFGNLICPSMNYYGIKNYYGINKVNDIIFSESKITPIYFSSYKF